MRESVTYMAILDEGRVEEARKIILRQGRKLFGPPDESTTAALTAMASRSPSAIRLISMSSEDVSGAAACAGDAAADPVRVQTMFMGQSPSITSH